MSYVKVNPISWRVHRLLCDCGGVFEHMFNIKYAEKPFTHVCNKCGACEYHEFTYPRTVWEEADSMNQQVREILK